MKTSTKIIIAVVIIILIAIIGTLFTFKGILSVATKEKERITAEEFYNTMQGKGYIVVDATEQFFNKMQEKEYIIADAKSQFLSYDYIEKVYVATPSDYSYKIEFYELTDNNLSLQFYNNNKSLIENSQNSTRVDLNGVNSNKFAIKSNGRYSTISRIDNTNIFVNEKTEYEEEIKQILQELGY